jgi:hypothetical protein
MVNGLTVREIKVLNTRPEKSSRPSKKDRKNIDDATYACIGLFIDSRDNTREEGSVAPCKTKIWRRCVIHSFILL